MNEETRGAPNGSFRRRKFNEHAKKGQKAFTHNSTAGMKGTTTELDGLMFLVPSETKEMRQDQFGATIERVKDCVSKTCKNPQDVLGSFDCAETITQKNFRPTGRCIAN